MLGVLLDKIFIVLVAALMGFVVGSLFWMFIAWEWHTPLTTPGSRLWLVFCILAVLGELSKRPRR